MQRHRRGRAAVLAMVSLFALSPLAAQAHSRGRGKLIHEASIDGLHDAIRSGAITCEGIIQAYLKRIDAFNGPCAEPGP
jgi:hypothetical protein